MVFVSHDRYFIDKLATRVFEVGGGAVHVFPGNYEDYIFRKSAEAAAAATPAPRRRKPRQPQSSAAVNGAARKSEAPAEPALALTATRIAGSIP